MQTVELSEKGKILQSLIFHTPEINYIYEKIMEDLDEWTDFPHIQVAFRNQISRLNEIRSTLEHDTLARVIEWSHSAPRVVLGDIKAERLFVKKLNFYGITKEEAKVLLYNKAKTMEELGLA